MLYQRIITLCAVLALSAGLFFVVHQGVAYAQSAYTVDGINPVTGASVNAIQTSDQGAQQLLQQGNLSDNARFTAYMEKLSLGSKLFQTTLSTALNTLAFDMANWVAAGGRGQGAAFERRSLGRVFSDSLDAAAGEFLSTLGQDGLNGFNMCNPELFDLDVKIGLGLTRYQRPDPECTFSELRNNWERELQSLDFLSNFQNYFEVSSNDAGIALSLQSEFLRLTNEEGNRAVQEVEFGEGWLDVGRLIDNEERDTPVGALRASFEQQAIRNPNANVGKFTGDALIDALNIFINQLAIQLINSLLQGGLFGSSDIGRSSGVAYNPQADPTAGGGTRAAREHLRRITQPRFDVRGDYSILSELSTCPDPTNAGPTNCVILDTFRQAIQSRKTVGEAMEEGFLNAEGVFGFEDKDQEPAFVNENYPYRSMIILRKFRIVPVGWEVAATYINENFNTDALDKEVYTLQDMVGCFSADDEYESGVNESWCRNLVNPEWVLKAPLNYCAREGYGPEILGEPQVVNDQYRILRRDNYCADEQTCIKENNDGSCEVYGYCTEERSTWDFGSNSCDPVYNTCETFRAQDSRQTISYLKNTLEWCDESGVGCMAYDTTGNYVAASGSAPAYVEWNDGFLPSYHFNKNVERCDARSEGCTEFIRASAELGTNLVFNGSFETVAGDVPREWTLTSGTSVVGDAVEGSRALHIPRDNTATISVNLRADARYILSAYVQSDGNQPEFDFSINGTSVITAGDTGGNWERVSGEIEGVGGVVDIAVYYDNKTSIDGLIDAVQLEEVTTSVNPSPYSDYHANAVYQKLLPDYLINDGADFEGVCYDGDGNLLATAPAICDSFTRLCTEAEAGCTLYTRTRDSFEVSGTVSYSANEADSGYCPGECDGYDTYRQRATAFEAQTDRNLIPETGNTCSARAVGCEEFTNLDEVAQGGEGIEYYSQLRQCTADSSEQAGFYTWEGDEDTGFQLRVFALQDIDEDPSQPDVTQGDITALDTHTIDGIEVCNETIFNADIEENADMYNPDCRQVYARDGTVTYVLFSKVIFYSTDCHPYRLSARYTDDAGNLTCLNNGQIQGDDCVYMAIPEQGVQCSAAEVSCREYVGNTGGNVRVVMADDFDGGSVQGWGEYESNENGQLLDVLSTENISLKANGASLFVSDGLDGDYETVKEFETNLQANKSYVVEFIARSTGSDTLAVNFYSKSADIAGGPLESVARVNAGTVSIGSEWDVYSVRLDAFTTREPRFDEALHFRSNGDTAFYIDSVTVRENTDAYYLIKDSWQTPESCVFAGGSSVQTAPWWDQNGVAAGPASEETDGIHLGCYEYTDSNNRTAYVKEFATLCSESAVGCELMIDTANYTPAGAGAWDSNNDGVDDTSVNADAYAYVVYDPAKSCDESAKGCMLAGQAQLDDTDYQSVYIENNPDIYDRSLCGAGDKNCAAWTDANGTEAYFKHPGTRTCEYRDGYDGEGWYQTPTAYCDIDGNNAIEDGERLTTNGCSTNAQCGTGISCITWDILCPATDAGGTPKTVGYGGAGNRVVQPAGDYVGVCPAAQSSCTEIIDPISDLNVNLLNTDGGSGGQTVAVNQNTLYYAGPSVDVATGNDPSGWYYLSTAQNRLVDGLPAVEAYGQLVYSGANRSLAIDNQAGVNGRFTEALVRYQLANGLDSASCSGQVDTSEGCVLFNVRDIAYAGGYEPLTFNAEATVEEGAAEPCTSIGTGCVNNSNSVLRVTPDRVCDEWLACRSQIVAERENGQQENVCYDIGVCDGLDNENQCRSWVPAGQVNMTVDVDSTLTYPALQKNAIANMAGYVRVGIDNGNNEGGSTQGLFPFGAMEQSGGLAAVGNGSFELVGTNGYPVGWRMLGATWTPDKARVLSDAAEADELKATFAGENRYHIDGTNVLQLGSSFAIASEPIEVNAGEYVLSALAHTDNLSQGDAVIELFASEDALLAGTDPIGSGITVPGRRGKGWQPVVGRFTIASNEVYIKLSAVGATSAAGGAGNFYFDKIELRPALEVRDLAPADTLDNGTWVTPQSCRLYPAADARACVYADDSGVQRRGWHGYCLQYDRGSEVGSIGNPNACLLWWPVDRVEGDMISEAVGYRERYPLYYCAEGTWENADASLLTEGGRYYEATVSTGYKYAGSGERDIDSDTIFADGLNVSYINWFFNRDANTIKYTEYIEEVVPGNEYELKIFGGAYDPSATSTTASAGDIACPDTKIIQNTSEALIVRIYEPDSGAHDCTFQLLNNVNEAVFTTSVTVDHLVDIVFTPIARYCSEVVQVVGAAGQNKFWAQKVYAGSDYPVSDLGYVYDTSATPFGSINPPVPAANPPDWDGSSIEGVQPLLFELSPPNSFVHGGRPYSEQINIAPPSSDWWADDQLAPVTDGSDTTADAIEKIRLLFARNYSWWSWNDIDEQYQYNESDALRWNVPGAADGGQCGGSANERTDLNEWCYVIPEVRTIAVNDSTSALVYVRDLQPVKLEFNSVIDDNQEPLVAYYVDWGDGTVTSVSGMEMRDRPDDEYPHALYHIYSRSELIDLGECAATGPCEVTPTVVIKDNWGWYSDSSVYNTPPTVPASGPTVVILDAFAAIPANDNPVISNAGVVNINGNDVTFRVSASDSQTAAADLIYEWDFGDGATFSTTGDALATHPYATAGNYTVRVTVRDGDGGSAEATIPVTLAEDVLEITSLTYSLGDPDNQTAQFFHDVYNPTGASLQYSWSFGDGETSYSSDYPLSHPYAPGTYEATLKVTNISSGESDEATVLVVIEGSGPVDLLDITNLTYTLDGPDNRTAVFSYEVDGTPLTYSWDFDDGSTSNNSDNPLYHAYSSLGTYNVSLSVSNDSGGFSKRTVEVVVTEVEDPPPVVNQPPQILEGNISYEIIDTFTTGGGAVGFTTVEFSATATDVDSGTLYYEWDFGSVAVNDDVAEGLSSVVEYTYQMETMSEDQFYTAWVTVTDGAGGSARSNVVVVIEKELWE